MTKLVFIITGLNTGGAEIMLLKLLDRLSPQFSAQVISLTDIGLIGQRIQALGFPVTALGMSPEKLNLLPFLRLVKLLQINQPDIVHTWMYHANFVGGLAAHIVRVPKIIWNIRHSDLSREHNKPTTLFVVKLCAQLSSIIPDVIQYNSIVSKDIHTSLGYAPHKSIVTPNGFDLKKFQPDNQARASVRKELGIAIDTPLIGLIARFDPQKNHIGFFEAAGYLHQARPDVHFLLAGHGVDANNSTLMTAIQQAKVAHVTHLLGLREDIPRLMATLDILASSSYGEAFPNVLGEAMACCVPCVVTDVGDSAYIVGETGRVVAPGDMAGFANALEFLVNLSRPERLTLGQQARHRVEKTFEIDYIVKLYESLY